MCDGCGGFVLDLLRGRFVFGLRSNFGTRASSARFATTAKPYESRHLALCLAFNAATIAAPIIAAANHGTHACHAPAAEPIIAATNRGVAACIHAAIDTTHTDNTANPTAAANVGVELDTLGIVRGHNRAYTQSTCHLT